MKSIGGGNCPFLAFEGYIEKHAMLRLRLMRCQQWLPFIKLNRSFLLNELDERYLGEPLMVAKMRIKGYE